PLCSSAIAALWRKTCGEIRLPCKEGHCCWAARTCLVRRYATPSRLSGPPRVLGNTGASGRLCCSRCHAQRGDHVFAQWCTPLFATFALTADMSACPQGDILPAEPDQLGDPQAGLGRYQQQRPVAPTGPCLLIGYGQKGINLGSSQKGDGRAVIALTRDRQDALDHATVARCPQCRVVEKRVNRREADIAAAGAGATRLLEIIEKRADHRRVEIVQRQRRRCFPEPLLGTAQQYAERVAVARDGVGTEP